MPHIEEIEYSLLHTMTATDAHGHQYQYQNGDHNKKTLTLAGEINLLPTPMANKLSPQTREDFTPNLAYRISLLPTPRQRDYKGSSHQPGNRGRKYETNQLDDAIERGGQTGLKLQPHFVEWMMGFPIGWLDLKHLETP